jgi:nucleoside-diphosphate-sugar epimerase
MAKIAIIGAAGYVGLNLSKMLKESGHDVVGITHSNGKFLLSRYGIQCEEPEYIHNIKDVDILINLAYPTAEEPLKNRKKNLEILSMIEYFAEREARIFHMSTQAVFGFDFDYPIVCGPVKYRQDYTYIEAKIQLENFLQDSIDGKNELHIIRLGNVWGPGSTTWTTTIVNKIYLGEPIGVRNRDGFCNLTDVSNVAAYISFLIGNKYGNETTYHHLAELSELKWSHWISLIGDALQREPVYVDTYSPVSGGLWTEIKRQSKTFSPVSIVKGLTHERYAGALLRALFARTPNVLVQPMRRKNKPPSFMPLYPGRAVDQMFLGLMSADTRFESVVNPKWNAPVDKDASWRSIRKWMEYAGYFD